MLLFSFIFNALLSYGLYHKQKLTLSGSIAAFLLGFVVLGFGHPLFYILMMSFLFSSLLINKVILRFIPNIKIPNSDHEPRRWINVMANGSLLGVASLLYIGFPSPWVIALGIISMAASTADTWASEIGSCSRQTPWTLIKRQSIKTGLSGGVSRLGLCASMFGSVFISVVSLPTIIQIFGFNSLSFSLFILFMIAGFSGSLVDSILGELFQAKFINERDEIIEVPQQSSDRLISGVKWIDNHMVNFLSNIITISIFTPLFQTIIR